MRRETECERGGPLSQYIMRVLGKSLSARRRLTEESVHKFEGPLLPPTAAAALEAVRNSTQKVPNDSKSGK